MAGAGAKCLPSEELGLPGAVTQETLCVAWNPEESLDMTKQEKQPRSGQRQLSRDVVVTAMKASADSVPRFQFAATDEYPRD